MNKTNFFLSLGGLVIIVLVLVLIFAPSGKTRKKDQIIISPTSIAVPIGMANPASVNCEKKGGTLSIKKRPDGGEYGICDFGSGQMCEEWALMRGDCPVGGIKVTGYDNEAQIYCAITGGQTLSVENATCTLKDSTVCGVEEYFQGVCPQK